MIYSGTYTVIKADVPEFFRRLKIVIIYRNIYMHMMIIEKSNLKKLIMSAKIFTNTTKKKEEKVL